MHGSAIFSIIIIAANAIISYKGFNDYAFFNRYAFQVDKVLKDKQYDRLVMSGFLHVDWMHLIFNMISFYSFSSIIEYSLGSVYVGIIYFVSLIGGDLLALFIHRHHGSYRAVGASGAVSGIIFAGIALYPGLRVLFGLPGWLYGLGFVVYSIYGMRSRVGNIGHEAHLGGAIIGLFTTVALVPMVLERNLWVILVIAIPCIIFLIILVTRPDLLTTRSPFRSAGGGGGYHGYETKDDEFNARKAAEQREVNRILEKIRREGLHSLSPEEKKILDNFSG